MKKQTNIMKTLLCMLVLFNVGNHTLLAAQGEDWVLVERFNTQLSEAQNGRVEAMYQLGMLYERGRGTKIDMQEAAKWFEEASSAGHNSARGRLGIMYVEGRGVRKDLPRALKLISQAAEANIASAQFQLASMYELGSGLGANIESAIEWYKRAAANGYYRAEQKVTSLSALNSSLGKGVVDNGLSSTANYILAGNWANKKLSSNYLPSSICSCRPAENSLNCISTAQERNTGREVITYNTETTISNFSKNSFDIEYVNNVLEVELQEVINEDGEAVMPVSSSVKKGRQEKIHHLSCTLINKDSISCNKDGLRNLEFVSQK